MSEDFEKLKEIGAQKIYEKTHIARTNVEYILEKSFDKIPKIQFRGFISILEREYHLDLSELLEEYKHQREDEYEDAIEHVLDEKDEVKSNKTLIFLVLIVTLIVGYFLISNLVSSSSEEMELNNSQIESAKVHLDLNTTPVVIPDTNLTEEQNATDTNQTQKSVSATRFEILTKRSLWIGYIDLDSMKKRQLIIQHNLELDPSKNYLIVFGHGMLKIDLGIEFKEYDDVNKKYFQFENGELTELTRKEFKKLNKGTTW